MIDPLSPPTPAQTTPQATCGLRRPKLWSTAATEPAIAPSERPFPTGTDPEFPPPGNPGSPQRRLSQLAVTTILRILLLGICVPSAWLLGIGAAQVLGHRSNQIPLQETSLRRASRIVSEVRYLPERWQQPDRSVTRVEPVPIPANPIEPLSQAADILSDTDRQIALEEVDAIATELRSLNRRLIDLETRLGRAQSTADLQSRLAAVRTSLAAADAESPAAAEPVAPGPAAAPSAGPEPLLETTDLQVTLPSDALFVPGEARLLETAPVILGTILSDLSRYPDATILVGSHTDDRSDATISRELAFRQAQVLQTYLASSLASGPDTPPKNPARWVTIGYGQSQPLGNNDTPEARQRNRRIEILVDRR